MHKADIRMSVTLLCPNLRCRAVLQVPESVRGKNVRCGHCATVFSVPGKGAETKRPNPDSADQDTEPATEKA